MLIFDGNCKKECSCFNSGYNWLRVCQDENILKRYTYDHILRPSHIWGSFSPSIQFLGGTSAIPPKLMTILMKLYTVAVYTT